MKQRLRIAASVFFAVLTVALCVLWVRSYFAQDSVFKMGWPHSIGISSFLGKIQVSKTENPYGNVFEPVDGDWTLRSEPVDAEVESEIFYGIDAERKTLPFGVQCENAFGSFNALVPYWLPVVVFAALAALPWFRVSSRFSLRTLLIATTLVAVVLVLAYYTVR